MLPLAAFAVPAAIQGGLGLMQLGAAGRMNPKRPEYQVPDEVSQELAMSRMSLNSEAPWLKRAEERLDQGTASAGYRLGRVAGNSSQLLAGLSGINMQANIARRGLMEADANDYARREANLRRSLGVMATYKDKQFQLNKMEPYMNEARTKAALTQGGLLNISGAANSGVQSLMGAQLLQNLQQQQNPKLPVLPNSLFSVLAGID